MTVVITRGIIYQGKELPLNVPVNEKTLTDLKMIGTMEDLIKSLDATDTPYKIIEEVKAEKPPVK